jgi:hypothetical protein
MFEKKISAEKTPITEDTFNKLAAGKSSICDAFIYSLSSLSREDECNNKLLECFKRIHICLQYVDDVDDFRKDIEKGQWTYAQYLVRFYLEQKELVITDPTKLHKYLFISGVAAYSIEKALENLDCSMVIADELGLPELLQFLNDKKKQLKAYLGEIELIIEKTQIKTSKSFEIQGPHSISKGLESGIIYLEKNCNNFSWADFLTSAGFGTAWITAYTGFQLAEINSSHSFLGRVLEKLAGESNAFNETIVEDGDSTTFKIGFMNRMNSEVPYTELQKWLKFMNADGGWVTYRDEKTLIDRLELDSTGLHGWLSSKYCITAAAAYILSEMKELRSEYNITCNYLIRNQSSGNNWSSYWWTSSIYATSFSIMALSRSDSFKNEAAQAVDWLIRNQHKDGYWKNELIDGACAFYSALALKALILFDSKKYKDPIKKGISWLIQNQMTDGSWLPNRILQIPATNVDDPTTVTNWRLSSLGVNCRVDDHNRVFTTATVVNTLSLFSKIFNKNIDVQIQYEADAEKPN